jgi:PhnB protein
MKHSNPYLFFNGNCKPAMESYQKILGGELKLVKVGDVKQEMFKDMDQNQVMHGLLKTPTLQIMASDNLSKDTTLGDNVSLYIECSNRAEVDQLFAALSKGGEVTMTPENTFWGAYFGSLTDAFGVNWMLSSET